MPSWIVGEVARLSVTVTDTAGAATDPASVVLKIKSPAGVVSNQTYPGTVIRSGAGVFVFDLLLTEKGKWLYRWETSAPAPGASQGDLAVTPANIT